MQGLHENQRKILDFLLNNPDGATLDELASHLEVSKTAAKEHLVKVDQLGYVTFVDTKGFIGRPRRRYLLSKEGHEVFPKQYSWLSSVLLEFLAQDLGKEGVKEVMTKLAAGVAKSMEARFQKASNPSELLVELTAALNELGYRTRLKQSDLRKGAILEASNCVYHSVAKRHPELCTFDLKFMENVTGMNVQLETCIAKGGSICRFCIKKEAGLKSDVNNSRRVGR